MNRSIPGGAGATGRISLLQCGPQVAMLISILVFLAVSAPAWAVIYDGFDYTAGGSLAGLNGGVGWASTWSGTPVSDQAAAPGLTFPGLDVSGNRAALQSSSQRLSRTALSSFGTDGTTVYFSFLIQATSGSLPAGLEFVGPNLGGGLHGPVFVGILNSTYAIARDDGASGFNAVQSDGAVPSGQTALLVLRADFAAGNDTFRLYLNPTPGALEPLVATLTSSGSINTGGPTSDIGFLTRPGLSIDEVRIGLTYAEVTVPEPGSVFLILIAAVTALRLRRAAR